MHSHTQFAGDRHPSGPGPCRPVEPLLGPLPSCAEQVHCGRRSTSESGTPRAILLLVRPVFFAACAMHRRVPCCSRNGALQCLLPPFAQGPTEHLMDKCKGPSHHHSVSRCKGKLDKQKTTHRSPSPGAVPTALVVRRWSPSAWLGQRLACCRGMRSHWALPGHLPSPSSPHSLELLALICCIVSTTVSLHTPWVDVVSKIRCLCSDHSFISVHCPAAMGTRGWYVRTLFADNQCRNKHNPSYFVPKRYPAQSSGAKATAQRSAGSRTPEALTFDPPPLPSFAGVPNNVQGELVSGHRSTLDPEVRKHSSHLPRNLPETFQCIATVAPTSLRKTLDRKSTETPPKARH